MNPERFKCLFQQPPKRCCRNCGKTKCHVFKERYRFGCDLCTSAPAMHYINRFACWSNSDEEYEFRRLNTSFEMRFE